jgi:hypothetical protein
LKPAAERVPVREGHDLAATLAGIMLGTESMSRSFED